MESLNQGSDYKEVNRLAWSELANRGCDSSRPVTEQYFIDAQSWLDPDSWIDWSEVRHVLCLASGGANKPPCLPRSIVA
jgi:hypothetical protein